MAYIFPTHAVSGGEAGIDRETATKRALKRQQLSLFALLAAVAGIFVAIAALLHHLESGRTQRELAAASLIAEHVLHAELVRADRYLSILHADAARHFAGELSLDDLQHMLDTRSGKLTERVARLGLLDAQGRLIAADRRELVGSHLAERDYFISAREAPDDRLRILARPSGLATERSLETALSRKIVDAAGQFRGVAVVLIRTDDLVAGMRELMSSEGGERWFALAHSDGTLMLMEPPQPGQVGRKLNVPGSLFTRHLESGRRNNFYVDTAHATGQRRFVDVRTISLPDGVPLTNSLVIASTRDHAAAFADWWKIVGALVLAWLLMLTIVAWVLRRERLHVDRRLAREAEEQAERARYEAMLAQQAERLQTIIDGTRTATWEWNVQTGEVVFNARWAEIIGYTLDELQPLSIDTWMRLAHPDDLAVSNARLTEHFEGRVPYYECEVRMRHREGRWIWVLDRGQVSSWTADGQPLLMSGTHQDVTARKEAELRVQDLLNEQKALIDSLPVGVFRYRIGTAGDETFAYASPLLGHLLGVTPAALLDDAGLALKALHPDDQAGFLAAKGEAGRERRSFSWRGRLLQDGRVRWVQLGARASEAGNGDIIWQGILADVSGEEVAAQALLESEQRFRSFFEKNRSVMLLIDPANGRIINANLAAANFYGLDMASLQTLSIDQINTLSAEEVALECQKALREERSYFNFRHRLVSGEIRDVEVYSSPIRLYGQALLFSIVHDITARRRAEEHQQQTEMLLRTAIETIGEAFVLYDAEDRLVFCNEEYRRFYAASAPIIEPGRTFEEIIRYGAERGQYAEAIGRVDAWVVERMAAHRAGDRQLVQPLDDGRWLRIRERRTANGYTVGFRVDVTELYQAKEAAEAASRAKSRFLATMSHEIRTPLNAILGMAQVLMLPEMDEAERIDGARTILESGQALLSLLNEVLDLARIEAGRLDIRPEPCRPGEAMAQVIRLFDPLASGKGLALQAHDATPAGQDYLLDAARIRQMLSNLVGNAVKFTPQGKVTVDIREVRRTGQTAELEFVVSDTGIGIAPARLNELFQPFAQLDSAISRQFEGSGLGLYTVRCMARLMGGDAGVASEEGRGSRFWFTVQADLVSLDELIALAGDEADPAVTGLSPDELALRLAELLPMLRRQEFQSLQQFRELRRAVDGHGALGAAFGEVARALDALDFAGAADRLVALAESQGWTLNR